MELLQGIVEVPGGEGHLLEYFNRVLTTQEIPSKWNEPLLIMIPKVAAPTLPKHLRPIAMSSAVGKLFARLLLNRALPKICPATYAQCHLRTVRRKASSDSGLSVHCLQNPRAMQGVGSPPHHV